MKVLAISGKARNGKTTVANLLKEIIEKNGETAVIVNYAGYVKYVCTTYFKWDGNKDKKGRDLLQNVGDGMRQLKGISFWIDKLMDDVFDFCQEYDYVIIDDCRYPNEIQVPKEHFDTYSIRINRENFESNLTEKQKAHKSETELDDFDFDYRISTISGVENLLNPVKVIYESIKSGDLK